MWVAGADMARIPTIRNAYLLIRGELIAGFGPMQELGSVALTDEPLTELDCSGRLVLPCWCDSHTHIVYAGSRETEFVGRIRGLSYQEIAVLGGGILNSAALLHNTSEEELYRQAVPRLEEMIRFGTGAVEIKSGYGLNKDDELKMLRVIRRLRQSLPVCIRATFLGAHAVPERFRGNTRAYVDEIINEMIPRVAAEELAGYIDVFCEKGYFSPEETARILQAGREHGLIPKIHANEMGFSGGVQVGVRYDALSVDHLEYLGDEEIFLLKGSRTMPTLLPGASFFLGMPYAPARRLIGEGLPVALASDCNPGSSPSGNMPLVGSLACLKQRLLPAEALQAMTLNGAYAMGISDRLGSITSGKIANVFITKEMPGIDYLFYNYGSNPVDLVILNGEFFQGSED